jgi:hypothetical protein
VEDEPDDEVDDPVALATLAEPPVPATAALIAIPALRLAKVETLRAAATIRDRAAAWRRFRFGLGEGESGRGGSRRVLAISSLLGRGASSLSNSPDPR